MKDLFLSTWIRLRHSDEGATLVEYGVAIVLAVVVGTGGLLALGGEVNTQMGEAQAVMQ
ncbi:hypothetical protein R5H30_18395 [Sulfitobacter sp. D35]|uniref:hypothetical protein n=1 Tax=Sulfitobacter sp. D35 TaxID=3083252 RepID=UPI00296E4700|nr:hypothetical protein [Sulfitobacter sp. D35]MDW4499969.1 hypothetical protein [Sulfitobacter sp. D35]